MDINKTNKTMNEVENMNHYYVNGLTDLTAKELMMFCFWFKSYEPNIEDLKNKFDWYYEQYNRMTDTGNKNFLDWITNEVSRQQDFISFINQDINYK